MLLYIPLYIRDRAQKFGRSCVHMLFFCMLFMGIAACGAVVKTSPMVALPVYSSQQDARRSEFKSVVERLLQKHITSSIEDKTHSAIIRVATYNVHQWREAQKEYTERIGTSFGAIYAIIKKLNADILILQQVEMRSPHTRLALAALGYHNCAFTSGDYIYACTDNGATGVENTDSCTMIASKVPFATDPVTYYFGQPHERSRSFLKIEVDLQKYGKRNLVVYGTLFDEQKSAIRLAEARALISCIHEYDTGKNVVLGAGFNEQMGAAIKYLASQGFINNFDLAGVDQPLFTHWSNKVLDGLYLKRDDWNLWLDGCHLIYQGASGHLPVVMDIDPTV